MTGYAEDRRIHDVCGYLVGTEEVLQDLCCRSTEGTVAGGVVRMCWRAKQGLPVGVGLDGTIAESVGNMDGCYRTQEIVFILAPPAGDLRIGSDHVEERE